VQAKDSQHEGPEGANGNKSAEFTINAPAPIVAPAKAEVVPVRCQTGQAQRITKHNGLEADKKSPQLLGTTVNWTASAKDPESDPISYRFLVNDTPNSDWQANDQFAGRQRSQAPARLQCRQKTASMKDRKVRTQQERRVHHKCTYS